MKRVELKRIAEFLWRGSPTDEKTPFASQGRIQNNGSFSKNFEADDNEKAAKEFPEDENLAAEGPMSISRKICFVMSFNTWIIYFLVLGWILPCRDFDCGLPPPEIFERNLTDIWPLTNVEVVNVEGLPSLAMLGYAEGNDQKLGALASSDATFLWNNTLPFIPRKLQCRFQNAFDVNKDGISDCLLSGYNDVYAFNASDGHVFWTTSLPSAEGNFQSLFQPTAIHDGKSHLIGTCGNKLVILDSQTGNKTSEIDLPCSSPFDIQIVTNKIYNNYTLWSLVCDYGDEIEAWGLGERELLSGGNWENGSNRTDFALLFRGSNSDGSIDLGCDVTPVPGGPLLLSWSDRVVMVTPEAIAWERQFPSPLSVASVKVGHFSSKDNEIAAAVRNGSNSVVFFMDLKNGSVIDFLVLEDRQAQLLEKVDGNLDSLVLKSLHFGNNTPSVSKMSDPVPWEMTNFALVDFKDGVFRAQDIVTTTKIISSTLNTQRDGETDLLVITSNDGIAAYQKYVLRGSQSHVRLCHRGKNIPHYIMES